MGTTLKELRRKVVMGFKDLNGEDILMAEEAINQACHTIAELHDFDELITLDTTNAKTVDGQKRYHLTTDLLLTRPKKIFSIVIHDDFNSRKIDSVGAQSLDRSIPYPEGYAESQPDIYTRQGDYIELVSIPDAIYSMYIRYSQWPLVLTTDTSECSYLYIDSDIIALARDIFISLRSGQTLDYKAKAKAYLKIAISDDSVSPDAAPIAQPFRTSQAGGYPRRGEYWKDPFVRSS